VTRRILHVIPFLWSGAGRVVTRLCREQARSCDVHIATTGHWYGHKDWPSYRRELRRAGVTWHRVNTFDRSPASLWEAVARVEALIRRLGPDVVHTHAGVPTVVTTIARERTPGRRRLRVVAQMYSWGPKRPRWMDAMDLWGFCRADRVVCSARAYERILLDGGVARRRLTCVPWGIDVDAAVRRVRPERPGGPRLGFVGRIEPRKDQLTLVQAFARAAPHLPGATLELIGPDGDPEYGGRVRQVAASLGVSDRVTFAGEVRSVWPHLAGLDLFVSLSRDEGQGLAVLEAMAAGVPVLARPVAGLEDFLVDRRNALFVTGGAPGAVARDMTSALADPARLARVSTTARTLVTTRYGWEAVLRAFTSTYGWRGRRHGRVTR
jgi:glycosyltransferase involved in cell wall biosynthesis